MSTWDVALAMVALPLCVWLLRAADRWWWWGDGAKACSSPAGHRRRMADWQRRIDEAQEQLDYYRATPNWFDLAWPVCDNLESSSDGEYCVNCFRQVYEHRGAVTA